MTQELLWKEIRKFQSDIARLHQVFVGSFCADAELEPGTEQVIRVRLEGGYEGLECPKYHNPADYSKYLLELERFLVSFVYLFYFVSSFFSR